MQTEAIRQAINERLHILNAEMERLKDLSEIYGDPKSNGKSDVSKSDRYRHEIRHMMRQQKPYHINDIQETFTSKNIPWNKAIAHQVINDLQQAGELIKIKVNGSNQRYYYMTAEAKSGGEYKIKEQFLPMDKRFIEQIEIM